jgi:hypothetical protein
MKNILVLAGGRDSDQNVFATALGAAQPWVRTSNSCISRSIPARLHYRNRMPSSRGARRCGRYYSASRPSASCGPPLRGIISPNSANFAGSASTDRPKPDSGVSASWREEMGEAVVA